MPLDITSLLLTALVSLFIPWLVATVAHATAPAGVKAVLSLVLNAANGIVMGFLSDPHFDWQHGVLYIAEGFVIATATHFGLWRPVDITGSTGAIARSIPGGIGSRTVDGEVVGRR